MRIVVPANATLRRKLAVTDPTGVTLTVRLHRSHPDRARVTACVSLTETNRIGFLTESTVREFGSTRLAEAVQEYVGLADKLRNLPDFTVASELRPVRTLTGVR